MWKVVPWQIKGPLFGMIVGGVLTFFSLVEQSVAEQSAFAQSGAGKTVAWMIR